MKRERIDTVDWEATGFSGESVLRELEQKWKAGFSCKLIAFRGMGTTSILQRLHGKCSTSGDLGKDYISVYVSGSYEPNAFRRQLSRRVREALSAPEAALKSHSLEGLCSEVAAILGRTGKTVVFLFDDFSKNFPMRLGSKKAKNGEDTILTEEQVTALGMWEEQMRTSGSWKVRFVLAYNQPVESLVDTGWYLKFQTVCIELLTAERAAAVLRNLERMGLRFDAKRATYYGGRHPVFLEYVARELNYGHSEESVAGWLRRRYLEMRSHVDAGGGGWEKLVVAAREPSSSPPSVEAGRCLFYMDSSRKKYVPFSADFSKHLTEVRPRNARFFVSYSHKDVKWLDAKSEVNLIPWLEQALSKNGVQMWYDHALEDLPGEPFKEKIEREIAAADFALLLLSQDFAISEFIAEVELPLIHKRVEKKQLVVLPIAVGAIDWARESHLHWIGKRQMLPGFGDPLINHTLNRADFEAVRMRILQAIRSRLEVESLQS